MNKSQLIITKDVQNEITEFCKIFREKNKKRPYDFITYWKHYRDIYEADCNGFINPIKTKWFSLLITNAKNEDLDALNEINTGTCVFTDSFTRCMLQNLLELSWKYDQEGKSVSKYIPIWLTEKGAAVPKYSKWNCFNNEESEDPTELM
jgi:hypothetical protein